tara:strand:+ start:3127 stop:4056 length:930 start_codon:yes stop_codon:yes gene_type:complete
MSKTVLVTNHKDQACGVYQYGKRVGHILQKHSNDRLKYVYVECGSKGEYLKYIGEIQPDIAIHNYLDITMPWFDQECFNRLRLKDCPQGLIVHNVGYSPVFDFYLHQHPFYPSNDINFNILRPLFNFDLPEATKEPRPPVIGTFGFGFKVKECERIVRLVNEQFDEATIRMHLTESKFCPNVQERLDVQEKCRREITKEGIKIEFSSEFLSDEAVVRFLNGNDLNVFLYKHWPSYNGVSSVIDYALSAQKPFAVNKSNMFAHVNNLEPSICVEDHSLKEIMDRGFEPVSHLHKAWQPSKFADHINNILG